MRARIKKDIALVTRWGEVSTLPQDKKNKALQRIENTYSPLHTTQCLSDDETLNGEL